jgi:hypothetical protein
MINRLFAPLLSAQFITAPTGRPRVMRNLLPDAPPPGNIKIIRVVHGIKECSIPRCFDIFEVLCNSINDWTAKRLGDCIVPRDPYARSHAHFNVARASWLWYAELPLSIGTGTVPNVFLTARRPRTLCMYLSPGITSFRSAWWNTQKRTGITAVSPSEPRFERTTTTAAVTQRYPYALDQDGPPKE